MALEKYKNRCKFILSFRKLAIAKVEVMKLIKLLFCLLSIGYALSAENETVTDETLKEKPKVEGFTLADLEIECRNNTGSDVAYEELKLAYSTSMICLSETLNVTDLGELSDVVENAIKSGNLKDLANEYCSKKTAIKQCFFGDLLTKVEACVSSEERKMFGTITGHISDLFELTCADGGNGIAAVVSVPSKACLENIKPIMQKCDGMKTFLELATQTSKFMSLEKFTTDGIMLDFTHQQCFDLSNLLKCSFDGYKTCGDAVAVTFLEGLFEFWRKLSTCRDFSTGIYEVTKVPEPPKDDDAFESVIQHMQRECKQASGGDEAYKELSVGLFSSLGCIQKLFNYDSPSDFAVGAAAAFREGNIKALFKKYCSRRASIQNCFYGNMIPKIEQCTLAEEKKLLPLLYSSTSEFIDLICRNEGSDLAGFLDVTPIECFRNKSEAIGKCDSNKTLSNFLSDLVPNVNNTISADALYVVNEQKCGEYESVMKCSLDEYKSCLNAEGFSFLEDIYAFWFRQTTCEKIYLADVAEDDFDVNEPNIDRVTIFERSLRKAMRRDCREASGSHVAFDEFHAASIASKDCLRELFNLNDIEATFANSTKENIVERFGGTIEKYCGQRPEALECIAPVIPKIDQCSLPEHKQLIPVITNFTNDVFDIACHGNSKGLLDLIKPKLGVVTCSESLCIGSSSLKGLDWYNLQNVKDLTATGHLYNIEPEQCEGLYSLKECMINDFENCISAEGIQTGKDLFYAFMKLTPCKENLIEGSTTEAAAAKLEDNEV